MGKRPRSALWVGLAEGRFRIEAEHGRHPFVLTSPGDESEQATLQLADGRRVESRDAATLAHLATGLPLTDFEIRSLLFGCPIRSGEGPATYRPSPHSLDMMLGETAASADILHFSRQDSVVSWRLRAMTSSRPSPLVRWRTEFEAPPGTVAKTSRLTSVDWKGQPDGEFDLRVVVDQVQVRLILDDRLFKSSRAPFKPVTLGDLRAGAAGLPLIVR